MRFMDTSLPGAFIVDIEAHADARGFFARTWCRDEFARHGIDTALEQCNISFNKRRGTLRGMHYQAAPYGEAKLVRCTRGRIYDVLVDLRPESPAFRHWIAVELSAENRRMVYAPAGVAHGFQTLEDDCELFYQMSVAYHPDATRGVRWNDAAFGIEWPFDAPILSVRDRLFPDFLAGGS
jgi:dTDP-4-dehydrorhamnose 3,5-epimerase